MADTTQNELKAAEAKLNMSGLRELLEIRFLRGDVEGCEEISDALQRERAELARLARKLRGRFGV